MIRTSDGLRWDYEANTAALSAEQNEERYFSVKISLNIHFVYLLCGLLYFVRNLFLESS